MARTRMVKPRLFADPKIARCSVPARYLFIGLLVESDDEGKLIDSAQRLAGNLFPLENISPRKVGGWLMELQAAGLIYRYVADETPCIWIPTFLRHQKISHPTPSVLPNPSGGFPESFANGSGNIPPQLGVGVGDEIGVGVEVTSDNSESKTQPRPDKAQAAAILGDWRKKRTQEAGA